MVTNIEDVITTPVKFSTYLYVGFCSVAFVTFLYSYGGTESATWVKWVFGISALLAIAYPLYIVYLYKQQYLSAIQKYENYLYTMNEKELKQLLDRTTLNYQSKKTVEKIGYERFGVRYEFKD